MLDNPDCIRMYRLCAELGLPVLVHIDVPLPNVPFWYGGGVDALERAMKECPRTAFIGHGPGFWREISGSAARSRKVYPSGRIVPGGKLQKLLAGYRNLYGDLSANSALNSLKRDVPHARRFLRRFHGKLLYGTDVFNRDLLDFLEGLNLDRKMFEAIAWKNAARLVPLK
jgi:predicted TIM-barrel fold metal-dependent hydrolase